MSLWNNADGLAVKFGLEEGKLSVASVSEEKKQHLTVVLDTAQTNSLSGGRVDPENPVFIPAGSVITEARFVVLTAFTSAGAATLDLGLGMI